MNIDAECKAALDRLAYRADARIADFRDQCRHDYAFPMRSIAQKARRLREWSEREFAAIKVSKA